MGIIKTFFFKNYTNKKKILHIDFKLMYLNCMSGKFTNGNFILKKASNCNKIGFYKMNKEIELAYFLLHFVKDNNYSN